MKLSTEFKKSLIISFSIPQISILGPSSFNIKIWVLFVISDSIYLVATNIISQLYLWWHFSLQHTQTLKKLFLDVKGTFQKLGIALLTRAFAM